MTKLFTAPDIECGGCAASIEKALTRTPGVQTVVVDVDAKTVQIDFDATQTSPQILAETLTDIGFAPSES